MKSTDVFISGAGIAGLITAIFCAEMGLSVTLCDPHIDKPLKASGRTSALMEESLKILKKADLYKACEPNSADLKSLSITDISIKGDHPVTEIFHATEMGQTRFGRNIINHELQSAALNRVQKQKKITILNDEVYLIEHETNAAKITTKKNNIIKAKLIIGADGRQSVIRRLSGIETWQHDYNQIAITGVVTHSQNHNNVSTEFHRDGGPFTLVPLAGMQSSFVFMNDAEVSQNLLKLTRAEFLQSLQHTSQNCLGTLNLIGALESFPIIALKAEGLIAPRTALIAEAAHVLSPIGAQGLNLSLRDCASLISMIEKAHKLGLDIGSHTLLKEFENERMSDISMRVRGTDILNRAVKFLPEPLKQFRRLGLKIAGGFTPLRHSLMQEGLRAHGHEASTYAEISSRTARARVTT